MPKGSKSKQKEVKLSKRDKVIFLTLSDIAKKLMSHNYDKSAIRMCLKGDEVQLIGMDYEYGYSTKNSPVSSFNGKFSEEDLNNISSWCKSIICKWNEESKLMTMHGIPTKYIYYSDE